ncbi:hypothetical protein D3C78_1030750 [compost metagenome]
MLHAQPHALHVDAHDGVELALLAVGQTTLLDLDAGIVEGIVQAAIGGHGAVHQRLDLGVAGHVAANEGGLAAGSADQLGGRLAARSIDIGNHDLGALTGERQGGGATDAGTGAGDQGNLAGKQLTH